MGSFVSVQTVLVVIMVIIDIVQVSNGNAYYKVMMDNNYQYDKNLAALAADIQIMIDARIEVLVLQVLGIVITWLCQWFTDVYLITVPVTFLFFSIMMFNVWHWWDDTWW